MSKAKENEKKGTGPQRLTVFVGQIPFNCSKEEIEGHFSGGELEGKVLVRMLTKKESNEFKGMAFLDVESKEDYEKALKMDYSVMKGRRLRVERTVGGGGDSRKRGLKRLLQKDQDRRKEEFEKDLLEMFEQNPKMEVKVADLDDAIKEFLLTVPQDDSKKVLEELAKVSFRKVKNRRRYLMGVMKRRLRELGQLVEAPRTGKQETEQKQKSIEEEKREITVARNYEDGQWHEVHIIKELSDDKVLVRFEKTGREQEVLREDIKSKTKRRRKNQDQHSQNSNRSFKRRRR
ncbi:hypothetical protein NDN08_007586 [Rhodosorus marinus]|uniref:RRM domain-containing protein n=1 Tax=Rhodosorus marinus TaxID=101924 RepID=A0AAV8UY01_9RHOD|nr:hypothetical protein NDN08_007586 [Rhodosorus marinus]